MSVFATAIIEALAAFAYMFAAFGAMAICERRDRLKRRSRFRALRRKHRQAQHEDEYQSKLARRIWELEDINEEIQSEYASARTKQEITIKGYGAAKLSEVLTACAGKEYIGNENSR